MKLILKLICKIFGHKPQLTGWRRHVVYPRQRVNFRACIRCGEEFSEVEDSDDGGDAA